MTIDPLERPFIRPPDKLLRDFPTSPQISRPFCWFAYWIIGGFSEKDILITLNSHWEQLAPFHLNQRRDSMSLPHHKTVNRFQIVHVLSDWATSGMTNQSKIRVFGSSQVKV
jgi:hypothetical protein